ncbi:hypothetical protein T01_6371 [Trichinella spiralis]|uniref:Uncharacterized protein n=1 Tax=Trichinella spiralis TaxID=6334 RepID=A0A0V1BTZ1_TRISP|nr:hypothetical protein T01_6371 [Trichinella spiralis]
MPFHDLVDCIYTLYKHWPASQARRPVATGGDVLLFPSFPQLGSQALLIPPSPYQVVHSTWGVITPVDSGTHTR